MRRKQHRQENSCSKLGYCLFKQKRPPLGIKNLSVANRALLTNRAGDLLWKIIPFGKRLSRLNIRWKKVAGLLDPLKRAMMQVSVRILSMS